MTLLKIAKRDAKRKAGKDKDQDKTYVSLFGSGASINFRKSMFLKTGVDIAEFSEESKDRVRQGASRPETSGNEGNKQK